MTDRPAETTAEHQRDTTTFFRWDSLSEAAASELDEPVLAGTPVSPVPLRAPGRGAWGHPPLAGAQVRYLVVTADRVVVFALDRDVHGPYLYRLMRVEIERPRAAIRGVLLRRRLFVCSLVVVLADGSRWDLEVSPSRQSSWAPVVEALGALPAEPQEQPASDDAVVAPTPDAPAAS